MARYLLPLLLTCIISSNLLAQKVQWASKVIEFSSELTPIQYSAQQVLGKPNVLPVGGESPNAWTPERANKKEFVKVGFDSAMQIRQVAIAESYNPTAIFRVSVFDENDKEYELNTFIPKSIPLNGRMLNIFVEQTNYKVKAVKIEFDGAAVPEYYSVDAIAITDSEIPIVAEIALPEELNSSVETAALSKNVNSEYKEFKPLLSPDGKILYFSRKNHPENIGGVDDAEDIWYAEKDTLTGDWKKAKNIGPELNNEGPNFISSVTPDGKTVVMLLGNKYLEKGKMAAGVSMSSNKNGSWTKPVPLNIVNEYNYSEKANFFLSNSRRSMILSVERDDSYGDRDLYVSFLQEGDSVWSEPLNLGKVVNSANEESSPFLATDDKTLYFSSNGISGYGGSDIYVSKRLDDTWTNWSEPQNLGAEINSDKDDLFFNIPARSEYAYYSRGVGDDDADIYRISLPILVTPEPVIAVRGNLLNAKTNEPVEAKIVYERLSDGKEIGMITSDPVTGKYELLLPAGEMYGIRAEADGYVPVSQNVDLKNFEGDQYTVDGKNLLLVPLEEDAVVALNNVFFDFNKSVLKKESFVELDRVVKMLEERKTMEIEVSGHTDNVGTESYNLGLSERRAGAVVRYFAGKGIKKSRIVTKFLGEKMPVASNDTDEGRQKNRRVEFKIVKE